jgi:hypothetical protein
MELCPAFDAHRPDRRIKGAYEKGGVEG